MQMECWSRLRLSALLAVFSFTGMAATTQEDCTAYLKQSDPSYQKTCFYTAENWSDNAVPGPGSTNYVGAGLTIYDPGVAGAGNKILYPGDVLSLAGTFVGAVGGSCTIQWPELRMQNGALYRWQSFSHLDGRVVIESNAENPSRFMMFHPGNINSTALYASFSGKDGTCFLLSRTDTTPSALLPDLKWAIRGDWSQFFGECRVCRKSQIYFYNKEHEIPGKITVENGGYWWFNSTVSKVTVGELDLQDGANYWGKCTSGGDSALVIVTNKLTIGEANIEFYDKWEYAANDVRVESVKSTLPKCSDPTKPVEVPIFKLVGEAAKDVPDLTKAVLCDYPAKQKLGKFPTQKALVCKNNDDGSKTIYAKYYSDNVIRMKKSNGSYKPAESAFSAAGDAIAEYWDPAMLPTSDMEGDVYALGNITWTYDKDEHSFPNLHFTIASGANVYAQCKKLTTKKITFAGSGSIQRYSLSGAIYGPIELSGSTSVTNTLTVYQGCTAEIHGDISGTASFRINSVAPHHNPVGYTKLYGSNVGLSGAFLLCCGSNPNDIYNDQGTLTGAKFPDLEKNRFLQLTVNRGDQFGGPYAGKTPWCSIHVNSYGCINIRECDVVVNEPTRGFFADNGVQFNVAEGKALTLDVPITYGGEIIKKGAGMLVVGNEARFIDGNIETPPHEGMNLLTITAGSLKAISAKALNGVCVKFAKGTALELDALPEDKNLAQFGIINTRWNEPFAGGEEDGSIVVKIEEPATIDELDQFSCAICTVAKSAAQTLKFEVPRMKHFICDMITHENDDESVTIAAEYRRRGKMFIKVR